jgi:glycerophosphoryl diester phosphodiesterase
MVQLPDNYAWSHSWVKPAIIAHRGAPEHALENTLLAFIHALELGADAVELDVRLTADHIPVVFHYYYLDGFSADVLVRPLSGPIYQYTWDDLRQIGLSNSKRPGVVGKLSTLQEVLEILAGRIGLEIEIKGPEPESVEQIAAVLRHFTPVFDRLEITSYEPLLLERFRRLIPGLPTDLLIPLSEPWMKSDVMAYNALQRGRLAGARAVHLHASQLSDEVVSTIRRGGCDVHAWGINDPESFATACELQIPRLCTDDLIQILKLHKDTYHGNIT